MPSVGLEHGHLYRVLGSELGDDGFRFTGEPTGRPPLPGDEPTRNGSGRTGATPHKWTEADRREARRLEMEGYSWAAIAEQVCGDRSFKSTVGGWLRTTAVAGNGAVPP